MRPDNYLVNVYPHDYPKYGVDTYKCETVEISGSFLVMFNAYPIKNNPHEKLSRIFIPANVRWIEVIEVP